MINIALYVYDFEVFAYDWLVVFKNHETKEYIKIHNDNEALKEVINDTDYFAGFNSKHYDQYIAKAICLGFTPEEVKEVNDFIIGGGQGWEYEGFKDKYFSFINIDLRDDMLNTLSLKAIEGHLGLPIRESNVPFDIDRPLTKEEIEETFRYCEWDVDTTDELLDFRKDYLSSKETIGKLAGIESSKALTMTNAKLAALMLQATPKEFIDERDYKYPDKLNKEMIPKEVFDFFNKLHDGNISDEEVFSDKLEISIGDCPVTLGYGGIHGGICNFLWEKKEDETMRNFDVTSYYPHLMILYNYISRCIPSADIFKDILAKRLEAKKKGDKATANALKLVVNSTYGATGNKYNALYDPLGFRSVCISGQLFLLELVSTLFKCIPDITIIQVNTDGFMIKCKTDLMNDVYKITEEWQKRTGFVLEEDEITKIVQKDVNNYLEIQKDGEVKTKGGYLVRGVAPAGQFSINNNARIVAKAVKTFFIDGTPVEETINGCTETYPFQLIAKAGSKYKAAYHEKNGQKVQIQKVNRVFASKDMTYGTLYKMKSEDDSVAKIESLPDHCIIDNENQISITDIDKDWYIELAKKRINEFLGIEEEKPERRKMATTKKADDITSMNVYQKLITARYRFLEENVKRTGKNMKLTYKYFQLDDIVPVATKIFQELHLLTQCEFGDIVARMTVINTDDPKDVIEFIVPMREPEPIVSNTTGAPVVNSVQLLGSSITYLRRYLYLIALDIAEADDFDSNTEVEAPKASVKPPNPTERKETAKEITNANGKATELQITQLKGALKKLVAKKPDMEQEIAKLVIENESFKNTTKTQCEELIKWTTDQLKDGE